VCVDPPFDARGPSIKLAPNGRLLAPESVKPVPLPIAQELILAVPALMSGAVTFEFPETMQLVRLSTALPPIRAMPPPAPAVAVLAVMVEFCTVNAGLTSDPSPTPPPDAPAEFPEIVLLRIVRPPDPP